MWRGGRGQESVQHCRIVFEKAFDGFHFLARKPTRHFMKSVCTQFGVLGFHAFRADQRYGNLFKELVSAFVLKGKHLAAREQHRVTYLICKLRQKPDEGGFAHL